MAIVKQPISINLASPLMAAKTPYHQAVEHLYWAFDRGQSYRDIMRSVGSEFAPENATRDQALRVLVDRAFKFSQPNMEDAA